MKELFTYKLLLYYNSPYNTKSYIQHLKFKI